MRWTLILSLALVLALSFGCAKKKAGGGGETGAPAAGGDIAKFDEGHRDFRDAIRFVSLTPDKDKAAGAAGAAEQAFAEVAKSWPEEPPDRYEGDNDWANRISTLTKLMADIKTQTRAENFTDAEASILETQKLLLELDEKSKINTAGDEAVRLIVLCHEMKSAFDEKRYNDMKHIMPNMREAQKNFFGSTVPPSAQGREDQFDDAKDRVYDGVDLFAEAPDRGARETALQDLMKEITEFYVEFG
jgi:hypothetical protein